MQGFKIAHENQKIFVAQVRPKKFLVEIGEVRGHETRNASFELIGKVRHPSKFRELFFRQLMRVSEFSNDALSS